MAFTAKILSWRFRHLNIIGCLLKKRPSKGGVTGTPGPPLLATPLIPMCFYGLEQYQLSCRSLIAFILL